MGHHQLRGGDVRGNGPVAEVAGGVEGLLGFHMNAACGDKGHLACAELFGQRRPNGLRGDRNEDFRPHSFHNCYFHVVPPKSSE
ncbi:hypothetical protein SDC9_121745 [bioreactor metagenome]|uniref:Uncharacterized protein n=1 Tax=bioreactor metagenome TaxID=1076179 RepID=A0A645CCR2_9ZZZZ